MTLAAPPPFPDRLRRRPRRRRSRHWLGGLALLPALVLVLPMWRVHRVSVTGGSALPPATRTSLEAVVGTWAPMVDLHWVRRQVTSWPAVAGADVRLVLPGTLDITVRSAVPVASVAVGSGWHGVTADGRLSGPVERPVAPLLVSVPHRAPELRQAIHVARRVATAASLSVARVRQVMPDDLEVQVHTPCPSRPTATVRVGVHRTAAEREWARRMVDCTAVVPWADARNPQRLVIGGSS